MNETELFAAHGVAPPAGELAQSMLVREGECLLWRGSLNRAGYPIIRSGVAIVSLTRLVFELTNRPLVVGEVVRHADQCRHRHCLAPKHLLPGTQADNMADMSRRISAGLPSLTTVREREFRARRQAAISTSIPHIERVDPPTSAVPVPVIRMSSTPVRARNVPLSTVARVHDYGDGFSQRERRTKNEPREDV